jgi:hypothetical protein
MVREEVRVILGATQRLDPLGCSAVAVRTASTRDLGIGEVADLLLPIPGTPTSVTSCGSRVRVAREKARSSTSSSSSRPTSGARPCWRTSTPTAE